VPELPLLVLVAFAFFSSITWGICARMSHSASIFWKRPVEVMMNMSRMQARELKSIWLGFLYLAVGIFNTLAWITIYGWNSRLCEACIIDLFYVMSLATLANAGLVFLFSLAYSTFARKISVADEVCRIPWLESTLQSSKIWVAVGISASASIEEMFFRGCLVIGGVNSGLHPAVALALSIITFGIQQVLQVNTRPQAIIIGGTSVVVGGISGLAALSTGSVLPGLVAHAAFAVRFTRMVGQPITRLA
jgi:hypothetical protein